MDGMLYDVGSTFDKDALSLECKAILWAVWNRSYCIKPLRIINGKYVSIGREVSILHYLRLEVYRIDNSSENIITIGDRTNIEQNVHITAGEKIHIGNDCSLLGGTIITDIIHSYEDINIPASKQKIKCKPVIIGDQCFIGMHTMIMPGVTLGKHVIVGANSVVTHSFPDNCVIAGVPAHMIKKYDDEKREWINTKSI